MSTRENAGENVEPDDEDARSGTRKPAISRRVSEAVSVEDALARALVGATEAGRWDVVAQIARELEARRLAGSNVVALVDLKRSRG